MKKAIIAIIGIAVLVAGVIFAVGQIGAERAGRGHFGEGGHRWQGMMLRGLSLTEEQRAQVKQILEASKSKTDPLRESMKQNRQKLQELTASGAFDEAAVTEIANSIGDTSAQLTVERHRTMAQIHALLTDEQKAKAAEMHGKMKGRIGERMKQRGAPDEGPAEF